MSQRILLIQDDPAHATAIREALTVSGGEYFQVEWVARRAEGLERLSRPALPAEMIAAVLVDLFLPDSQGIETFDRLFLAAPNIPILVLSASSDEEIAKVAVQHGAQDYLLYGRIDGYWLPKILRRIVERAAYAQALSAEKERAQTMLNSIGDAVLSIDDGGRVTYLNEVAEGLTGWSQEEAAGQPLEKVLPIIDGTTRETILNPMITAIREQKTVSLTPNCVLIRRDGVEAGIEDSAAPIHDRQRTRDRCGHGISRREHGPGRVAQNVLSGPARQPYRPAEQGLLNDRLNQAMGLAHRHRRKLAMLFLDVDRFKHINDSMGHAVGDRLLQVVARRLLACVRSSDTVSRQGGDEFVILLPDVTRA